jgi:hypothetical protein
VRLLLFMISHGQWMMAHVMIVWAHGVVMEAMSGEGHASSLEATGNFLIWLLLIVVKITSYHCSLEP